jgi:hypothetical protein
MRRRTTSPGTSSRLGMTDHLPSRLTRALSASLALRAATVLSALNSSQKPTTALTISSTRMMTRSDQWRSTPERTAATSIIHGIGPQKYERNLRIGLSFFSGSSL